jgi:hypothetical protein
VTGSNRLLSETRTKSADSEGWKDADNSSTELHGKRPSGEPSATYNGPLEFRTRPLFGVCVPNDGEQGNHERPET